MKFVNVMNGEYIIPETFHSASGRLQDLIQGFAESGHRLARVMISEGEYSSIGSARSALTAAVKSTRKDGYIRIRSTHGNLFVVNELK